MGNNKQAKVALLGLPFDDNSSYERGPALAPDTIKQVLKFGSLNNSAELKADLNLNQHVYDAGNVDFDEPHDFINAICQSSEHLLAQNFRVLSLGGDHSVTYPLLSSYHKYYEKISVLHIDAHTDLYDNFKGNRYSNACPFARVMEESLCQELIQVGIRTVNLHQQQQIEKFSVISHEMKDWPLKQPLLFKHPVYLSLDIDALDPAYAPGVSHREPGGLATRELINLIQQINMPVIGADLVEFNPRKDIDNMTAQVAAKLVKEIVGKMLQD